MKILVNATTIVVGGGIQNVYSLLNEALNDASQHEWHLAVSDRVEAELRRTHPLAADKAHVFTSTPARDRTARRQLQALEAEIRPDCVFTYNGPAYAKFRAPHLLGFATPWVTHATWLAYRTTRFPRQWVETAIASRYKAHWFRFADAWVTETDVSKFGLVRRLGIDPNKVYVVPNSCGPLYFANQRERSFPCAGSKVRLLCFAAAYPHKRIEFLPEVAKELSLRNPELDFEFVITLPEDCQLLDNVLKRAAALKVLPRINNQGRISVADGPKLYDTCDICFMPTVLETFSATYPEAMAMGLPIVTTDLEFASDVCQDAALYFEPNNAASAADCIQKLLRDETQWRILVAKGKSVLQGLPTPRQKYDAYLRVLCDLVDGKQARQPAMSQA